MGIPLPLNLRGRENCWGTGEIKYQKAQIFSRCDADSITGDLFESLFNSSTKFQLQILSLSKQISLPSKNFPNT